jgi:DNA-binding NtrC family response regulator
MRQFKTSDSHRVLLADDDEAVREVMGMTLESKGFEVTPAASVTVALKLIMSEPFDVLATLRGCSCTTRGYYK